VHNSQSRIHASDRVGRWQKSVKGRGGDERGGRQRRGYECWQAGDVGTVGALSIWRAV